VHDAHRTASSASWSSDVAQMDKAAISSVMASGVGTACRSLSPFDVGNSLCATVLPVKILAGSKHALQRLCATYINRAQFRPLPVCREDACRRG
jgi:hypothetical protein